MKLDKNQLMRLRVLYTKFCTVAEIAEELKVDKQTILQALSDMHLNPRLERDIPKASEFSTKQTIPQDKANSIKSKAQIFTPDMDKQIGELLSQRLSNQEIADKLGVTYQQLASRMCTLRRTDRLNIPTNKTTPAPKAEISVPKIPAFVIDVAKEFLEEAKGEIEALQTNINKYKAEIAETKAFLAWAEKKPDETAISPSSQENFSKINDTANTEDCQDGD